MSAPTATIHPPCPTPSPSPPLTADALLQLAARDPSAALPLLPSLPSSLLSALLSSLSPSSPPHLLSLIPSLLSLSPSSSSSSTLDSLLSSPWPTPTLLTLSSLLRDFPPPFRSRVPDFLSKIFSHMPAADVQDLPALAYQLLLLASKALYSRMVVAGLLQFFGRVVRGPPFIARQVEGTVLMHVTFAVKQDPSLAREIVAAVKADVCGISHFAVAVLLSVARVRRYNESAVGVLRFAAVASRRDYRMSRHCKWSPNCLREECAHTAQCVEKALLKAVNESIGGREHVVPSIVQLGFLLLETTDGDRAEEDGLADGSMGVEELGIKMLKALFEIHEMARTEIIEQCKFRILSAKPQQSAPVLRLLGCLVRSHPFPMLEYIAHLKELLDYFAFMNDKKSTGLINCVLPLTKFSRDLQDYIILVVRKAMFKREAAVRIAATNAIVELIVTESKSRKNEPNPFQDSSSQPSSSQQADMRFEVGRGLFQDLSGLLRRCLSQQARVKEVLYEGLIRIVTSDPVVADNILDFLWPHFLNYYTEDADCPLKIESCFKVENAKVCVVEPLDCLLSCVSRILQVKRHIRCERPVETSWKCFGFAPSQDNEVGRASSSDLFAKALSNIQKYLIKCCTEDQRGQSQEAGSLSSPMEIVHCHNFAILGIIEVFINFSASDLEKTTNEAEEIFEKETLELIDAYSSFERKTSKSREKIARRKGHSSDATNKQNSEPKENSNASFQKLHEKRGKFLVTSIIYELVVISVKLCNADSCSKLSQGPSQSSFNKLDQCLKLVSFVLKACLENFKSVAAKRSGPTIDTATILFYDDAKKLARPVMQLVWWLLSDSKLEDGELKKNESQRKKISANRRDQIFMALVCLKELFKISLSDDHFADIIEDLISLAPPDIEEMMDAGQDIGEEDAIMVEDLNLRSVHTFLNRLKLLYTQLLSQSLLRESEAVAELIFSIVRKLHPKQRHLLGIWAAGMCRNKTVQSPSTAREVVKLAVHLITAPDDMILVHDMASELQKVINSTDESPIDTSEAFPVINCSTKSALVTVFLQVVESSLTELDWVLSKLKAMLASYCDSANLKEGHQAGERPDRLHLEEALYLRSTSVVHVLSSITQMSLKDSQAEQFLKLTARFYKLLARMSKSQIAPKGFKQFIPSLKFQKLAEVTCRMLTVPLYDFVCLVQENQQASKRGILAKIKRESRCIPDLIFQIEDYEKYLIQLSKLTKVNLLRHAKRSISRDFQIRLKEKSGEERREHEPSQASTASSESEPDEDPEAPDQPNVDENAQFSGQCGPVDEDSETDKEDQDMLARRKRAKTNQIVQDSDEEA